MLLSPLAFDRFVAPARLRPQIWRFLVGLAVVMVVYVAWMGVMVGIVWAAKGGTGVDRALGSIGTGSTPGSLILLLLTFVGMALGVFAATRWLHKRPIATLFGPRQLVLRDFATGFGIFVAFAMPGIIWFFFTLDLTPNVSMQIWLLFLPLALIGLLIQTGAEELIFRGYMQQQLAARFASRWVWMVLPSVIFGLVHYAPEEMGDSVWLMVFVTGFFGLVMADLTARSGSLGMAWGLHFANNLFAVLVFTTGEALDGLALYRLPFSARDTEAILPLLAIDLLGMILVWAACRYALRRR
ncbi:CPBP family intramembrane glutamic endopeptidase [Natronohydrobacter thiooxidans]|uniref:CPBP family intramembrane glutamic endopeptidase n=1 Tax=Natronohydrobacter thiooxidans TaxID=87172 RepID=UPI0008FF61BC|nr:CPBP family intramembrane glutamic endopeptidase [Natronohydrobacter thiooxidans]